MRISTLWRGSVLSLLIFGLAMSFAYAQERTVTGKVSSEEEGPLPGVNIILQGTGQGTVSDIEGNYSLVVPGPESILVFSSIGYTTEAVTVGNQSVIDMMLVADVTSLKEIVVTGYATQQKQDLTGSVGVVSTEELNQMPQGNVTQQLQGRVSGVTVTQDSRPGQNARVRIRGFASFYNNDPLYVVDGVQTTDINTLNPDDIESISVLKDAGAASIYGSRASNGVIVVTTKNGRSKGISVNYNMYVGSQDPGKGPSNLLNTQEYADLQWLVYKNDQLDGTVDGPDDDTELDMETHPIYGPSNAAAPQFPSWAADTKWYDEIFNPALIMNHDLSLSGGNENSKFYAGLGYFQQDGTVIKNWWKRVSARFNSEFKIKDRVTIGENMNITFRTDNGIAGNGDEGTAMMMGVYRAQPIIPVVWNSGTYVGTGHTFENGEWGGTAIAPRLGNGTNYVANQTRNEKDKWQNIRLLGNVFVDVKIIEGLNFRTTFGGSFDNSYQTNWTGTTYENAENTATASYWEQGQWGANWNWTNTLTYNKSFGEHNLLLVGGYEAVETGLGRRVRGTRADYFSETFKYRTVSTGASITGAESDFNMSRTLASMFLRADYNFKNKYYASATVRRDGASVFGADNRYGTFPSGTVAWRISEESFLAGSSFISDMKIRGGYGIMGSQFGVNPSNQFSTYGGSPNRSFYDLQGTGTSSMQGFRPTRVGNPVAQWETNTTTNVGVDLAFLDNKFELVVDWYQKNTKDVLFTPELIATKGGADAPAINIAEMNNNGIDINLVYKQTWSDFRLAVSGQFTHYKNEIVKIADGYDFFDSGGGTRIGDFNRNQVGHALGEFFGYNVVGLFQEDDFVNDSTLVDGIAVQDGSEPGVFRYENIDQEGTVADEESHLFGRQSINPNDRTFIGDPNPDFTYGLNVDIGWKNFDLTAFFYGSQGNDIFNYNRWWTDFWPSFQGQKSTDLLYNSWTPERTDATTPKASNSSNFSTNTQSTSYYVEDGSYFRLKNLQVGYNFPQSLMGNVFTKARIYVQGVNLFTITKYSGLDPELASFNDDFRGVDEGSLPTTKQYIVGVQLGF
jgi:TonB-linked SusC/RagA family outer membrane protein